MNHFAKLQAFRQQVYELMGNERAAVFDPRDAVLSHRSVSSFAELSLLPVSSPLRLKLMELYLQQMRQPE
jgi:hypothetical protein